MPAATVGPNGSNSKNPLRGAVEILPDRLYYCALKTPPASDKLLLRNKSNEKIPVQCFCMDDELVYWNFFLDYGPLNLGQLYRFTIRLHQLLQDTSTAVLFYSSTHYAKRVNAIYLICAWQVLELQRTPENAFYGFSYYSQYDYPPSTTPTPPTTTSSTNEGSSAVAMSMMRSLPPSTYPLTSIGQATTAPLPPFHDASPVVCSYELNIMHCLEGLQKAKQFQFFDWDTFNVEEYEHYEQVENGDLNWIIQNKIIAFAGPSYTKNVTPEGYCTLSPKEYIPYFRDNNVTLVVRLNKKNYHEKDFIDVGISHLDQYYLDGSCPPMKILQKVLTAFESVPENEAFAVHCKAGLGRTGTCIGAYLMKHYRMTAPEAIAWMRICRPGCVIGPQQQFLQDLEPIMWQEGDMLHIDTSGMPFPTKTTKTSPSSTSTAVSTNSSLRIKNNNNSNSNNKRTTPYPKIVTSRPDGESIHGRPGQADGLLSRKFRQTTTSTSTSTPPRNGTTTPERKGSGGRNTAASSSSPSTPPGAVPVTPDSVASATSTTKGRSTRSSKSSPSSSSSIPTSAWIKSSSS